MLLDGVAHDPAAIRKLVATSLLHPAWARSYGHRIPTDRADEQQLRHASEIADVLWRNNGAPLTSSRDLGDRAIGTCRNFTVFNVAVLRQLGFPSRARCGHASYFEKGKWVDHWIVERWSSDQNRWVRSDPQLDERQLAAIGANWSPDDLPEGAFLSGGECWAGIRDQTIDPAVCGIFDMWGAWFVRSNVVRDLAALNKIELLPWDVWGVMQDWTQLGSEADNVVVDRFAAVCASDDLGLVRATFDDPLVYVPNTITTFLDSRPIDVAWRNIRL